jgi:hypothetical protein
MFCSTDHLCLFPKVVIPLDHLPNLMPMLLGAELPQHFYVPIRLGYFYPLQSFVRAMSNHLPISCWDSLSFLVWMEEIAYGENFGMFGHAFICFSHSSIFLSLVQYSPRSKV